MRVKNNLLYKNVSCSGGAQQTNIRDTSTVVLTSNAIETSAPGFVNEAGFDLHLAAGSRMIDAAGALTTTSAAGNGTQMAIQDASYFFDGHDISGEVGDTIQILGQTETAVVVDVNYATNTLTLSRALTWPAGAGVALAFSGSAPDMGAYEAGGAARLLRQRLSRPRTFVSFGRTGPNRRGGSFRRQKTLKMETFVFLCGAITKPPTPAI